VLNARSFLDRQFLLGLFSPIFIDKSEILQYCMDDVVEKRFNKVFDTRRNYKGSKVVDKS